MEQINVYSGSKVLSRVFVQDGIEGLEKCLDSYQHVFAVMDENVAMHSPHAMQIAQIMNSRHVPGKLVAVSEETKTMETVMDICEWLLDSGADRNALVLAIGGGITTDIVGFAASIYKRESALPICRPLCLHRWTPESEARPGSTSTDTRIY
jgi:3-dehydroquinate synthetase